MRKPANMAGMLALREQHKCMTILLEKGRPYNMQAFAAARRCCSGCVNYAPQTLAAWEHYDNGPRGNLSEELVGIRAANGADLAMNRKRCLDIIKRVWEELNAAYPEALANKALIYGGIALQENQMLAERHGQLLSLANECRKMYKM